MLRLTITLLAALTLALTACDNDEESPNPEGIPIFEASPTPNTIGDAITICAEIGVPGGATPSSPTPEPSCEPGDDFTVTPNIRARIAEAPALPSRMTALTRYLEFETDQPGASANLSMPLTADVPIGRTFAWHTHESGEWRALNVTVQIHTSTISGQDAMASGDFQPAPANLILLAKP